MHAQYVRIGIVLCHSGPRLFARRGHKEYKSGASRLFTILLFQNTQQG